MNIELFEIAFNPNASNSMSVTIPAGTASTYPAISALLWVHQHKGEYADICSYKFDSNFQLSFIWRDLLQHGQLPKILNFPPEVSSSYGNTLELQAARMLLNHCLANNESYSVKFHPNLQTSLIYNLIETSQNQAPELNTSVANLFGQNCTTSLVSLPADDAQPNFDQFDELLNFDKNSRAQFALWLNEHEFFRENKTSGLIKQIYQQSHTLHPIQEELSNKVEDHYFHCSYSMHDVVLLDRKFVSQTSDDDKLHADLLNAYAHIKTSVPFSTKKLDQLIEKCDHVSLSYWKAYLLAYGHIVRAYSDNFNFKNEFPRFVQAHKIFKSLGDYVGITRVYHAKASLLNKAGNDKSAIRLMKICRDLRTFLQEPFGVAKVLNGLAFVYLQNDKLEEALESHLEAERNLIIAAQHEELAFTYVLISWVHFLSQDYPKAVSYCEKALELMDQQNLHTLAFRTKPDIHAQLGLCYFYNGNHQHAIDHSNYCEAHKVDSSSTGELHRTLLRGLINDYRGDVHLAEISFKYIPELILENANVDVHVELLYYRIMAERLLPETDQWKIDDFKQRGIQFCRAHELSKTIKWFN